MKTCVIIPSYNEDATIGELVRQIRNQNLEVVVIDDGSTDNTPKIAVGNGAIVLRNDTNQGKGASLVRGFNYALDKGFDAAIAMDADGQHSPDELSGFIQKAQDSDSAIIVGNRMNQSKGMPLVRLATNKFMSWLISIIAKQNIPDTQCGFRLIKREVLEKVKLTTSKFEIESEVLIKAARLGFKIGSVDIKTIYAKEKSQINPFLDTLRFFSFIIREIWTTRP